MLELMLLAALAGYAGWKSCRVWDCALDMWDDWRAPEEPEGESIDAWLNRVEDTHVLSAFKEAGIHDEPAVQAEAEAATDRRAREIGYSDARPYCGYCGGYHYFHDCPSAQMAPPALASSTAPKSEMGRSLGQVMTAQGPREIVSMHTRLQSGQWAQLHPFAQQQQLQAAQGPFGRARDTLALGLGGILGI